MSAAIFIFAVLTNGLIIEPLKSIPQIKHKLINTALRNRKSNCINLYSSDNETENIIFDTKTYFSKFSEDICGAVKEIVISAPRLNKSVAKKIMNTVDKNIDFRIVTKTENNDIVSEILSSEKISNCEFIMYDNAFQNFAVIDRRIVWYGNINFLSYNYSEESAMRLINESVAGSLTDILDVKNTLFDC